MTSISDGLAHHDGHVAFRAGHGIHGHLAAEEALGLLAEAAQDAGRSIDLAPGLPHGLAVLLGEQPSQLLALGIEAVGGTEEDGGTLVGGHVPHGASAVLGGVHGTLDILARGIRDVVDEGSRARVPDGDDGSVRGVAPGSRDEHPHLPVLRYR
jgi:hypothetical protein